MNPKKKQLMDEQAAKLFSSLRPYEITKRRESILGSLGDEEMSDDLLMAVEDQILKKQLNNEAEGPFPAGGKGKEQKIEDAQWADKNIPDYSTREANIMSLITDPPSESDRKRLLNDLRKQKNAEMERKTVKLEALKRLLSGIRD